MTKLIIKCSTRPGNAEMGALTALVGAVFGLDKELEYFEGGLHLELDGQKEGLEAVLGGVNGDWPTKTPHQDMALAFYPGGLAVCQRVIRERLKPVVITAEITSD